MIVRSYDYFNYHLPEGSADGYARNALAILGVVKEKFPEFYDNFRQPSEVLTLSGVRAFDTYYAFDKKVKPERVAELKSYLAEHNILLLEEELLAIGDDNPDRRYSLVHTKALLRIQKDYGYVPGWPNPDVSKIKDFTDFMLFWLMWKQMIAISNYREEKVKMPKEWADSWSRLHDITFGMLLGYPGEAICSAMVYDPSINSKTIKIVHAETEGDAWPTYFYDAVLTRNRNIKAHARLWSDILEQVYSVIPKPK